MELGTQYLISTERQPSHSLPRKKRINGFRKWSIGLGEKAGHFISPAERRLRVEKLTLEIELSKEEMEAFNAFIDEECLDQKKWLKRQVYSAVQKRIEVKRGLKGGAVAASERRKAV